MSRDDKRFLVGAIFIDIVIGVAAAMFTLLTGEWTPLQMFLTVNGMLIGLLALIASAAWVAKRLVP